MKEEPKQEIELIDGFIPTSFFDKQQTLEGALKNELEFVHNSCRNFDFDLGFKTGGLIGAEWQAEQDKKTYSEKEMLDFAWFLIENVGQYSDDEIAHFQGKYLEKFKKK